MKTSNLSVLRYSILFFALLIGFSAFGQNGSDSEGRDVVLYDPLFWKDELALRQNQSRKIEQINTEFYESLRLMKDEQPGKGEMNRQLERGLQQRSDKIWQTLLPKQRRKLEKIIDKNAPVTAP
jgi:hypothetical protein